MNIAVAHIEAGDISGTLDEQVRHAITKLAHLHIATNDAALERLRRMGENPRFMANFGSPDVEVVEVFGNGGANGVDLAQTGSGMPLNIADDFMVVMYHPVWQDALEEGKLARQTRAVLEAVHELAIPAIWFWPNADVGGEEISHELRIFRDQMREHKIRFMRYLPPRIFIKLLGWHQRELLPRRAGGQYWLSPAGSSAGRKRRRCRPRRTSDRRSDQAPIRGRSLRSIDFVSRRRY
jgi:UDP-N-acetylglucosamine 2-epimerase